MPNLFYSISLKFKQALSFGKICAQDDASFLFGVKGGLNVYSSSIIGGTKRVKGGYQIGAFTEYACTESFYLHTGVNYITKGVRLKGSDNEGSWRQTINLEYIQIPLLATFKLDLDHENKLFVNIGPYYAIGINGNSTKKNEYGSKDKEIIKSFGDNQMKGSDYGIKYSIGLELNHIIGELTFEYGLKNIEYKNNKINSLLDNSHFKNKGFSLLLGYRF